MQTAFMTVEALRFAAARSSQLASDGSKIRIAAFAQPEPGIGKWDACRLDWSDEPGRAAEFIANGPPASRH